VTKFSVRLFTLNITWPPRDLWRHRKC